MTDRKRSFVMYNDYIHHFEILPKDEQADLIMLILRYTNGMELNMESVSGSVRMAFSFIRLRLDEDYEKYQEVCRKRSLAAKSAKAGKCIQMQANATDNDNENDTDNDTDNENDTDTDIVVVVDNEYDTAPENVVVVVGEGEAQPLTSAADACPDGLTTTTTTTGEKDFNTPTYEQVRNYCNERNNGIDPQKFIDYYSTNGWKVGRNPMKDWKAAIRVWENRDSSSGEAHKKLTQPVRPRARPSYDPDEVEARVFRQYEGL